MKFCLIFFVLSYSIFAQVSTKFYAFNPKENDKFGYRVTIEGNLIFISSQVNEQRGCVYVYALKNNLMSFIQKITPDSSFNNYFFGANVAIKDSLLYISSDGHLFIYKYLDSLFYFDQKISGSTSDDFAMPFAEYKRDLLIGAHSYGEFDQGAVFYFPYSIDSNYVLKQILEPSIFERYSQFGSTLDFDSSFAVISAPLYGYTTGPFRGMVFLYEKSDSGWVEKQRIYSPDSAYNQLFGVDLQIDNRRIAIGATGNPSENFFIGRIYIYSINDSNYAVLEDSIYASDSFTGNYFGYSFKLKGDSLFIGANGNELVKNTNLINRKWAYLYVKTNIGWEEKLIFSPTNQFSYNGFGYDVDFDSGNFLVGSPTDSDKKLYGGAVYLFQPNITSIKDYTEVFYFNLEQNYPNPFNPSTTISYSLPSNGFITLKVYDVLGNQVATLLDEYKPSGSYAIEFNASNLSSGIYFYSLTSGSFTMNKKMILLK